LFLLLKRLTALVVACLLVPFSQSSVFAQDVSPPLHGLSQNSGDSEGKSTGAAVDSSGGQSTGAAAKSSGGQAAGAAASSSGGQSTGAADSSGGQSTGAVDSSGGQSTGAAVDSSGGQSTGAAAKSSGGQAAGAAPYPSADKAKGRVTPALTGKKNVKNARGGDAGARPEPLTLRQAVQETVLNHPVTIKVAVEFAAENYPNILKSQAQMRASFKNVKVQKLNEYLPDSLFQYQTIMASHNKLSQVFYGSPVFTAVAGPGFNNVNMEPIFFSGGGVSLDWAPLDFGLHKARIRMVKDQYLQAQAEYATTRLDVCLAAANAYLDCIVGLEQLKAARQNQDSFLQFSQVVHSQVASLLKPGADASLADAQLANAQNDVIRANLAYEIALANLANTLGLGGKDVRVNPVGMTTTAEPGDLQTEVPFFDNIPVLQTANAALVTAKAQKHVLDKMYYPVFHFLAGFNVRGAGLNLKGRPVGQDVDGIVPVRPNYQVALIINWNFLDIFRLKAEKRVQMERIEVQKQDCNLVLQNLKTQDQQSRARVKAALALAENMPLQVQSAVMAVNQAQARYRTGLGSVARVAKANQVLAHSRTLEAIARVGVWRALLAVAAVHGDIKPFLAEAERVQRGM
jgi:outer membrane protein